MNKIVFFSGLDCSGKSTQIEILNKKPTNKRMNKKYSFFGPEEDILMVSKN